jgi:GTPase
VLVLLLDLASVDGRTPEDQERVLLDELERYRPELLDRPRLVVGSKADVATSELRSADSLTVSAVTRAGLDQFLGRLGSLVDAARATEPETEPFVVLRPVQEGFSLLRDGDGAWRVAGRSAERVVAMADLTNEEAIEYVQVRLRRMGVERALARAGAREGDVVRVGPVELEYQEGIS